MKFFKRHRIAAFILGVTLSLATGAAAAWLVYSGISGSAGGGASSTSPVGALQFTAENVSDPAHTVDPFQQGDGLYDVSNPSGQPQKILTISAGTVTDSVAGCAAHFTFNPSSLVGKIYPTGITTEYGGKWTADASTPVNCANSNLSVTLTGTTQGQ